MSSSSSKQSMSSSSSKASCASHPAPKITYEGITYEGSKTIITTNRGTMIFDTAPMKSPSTNVKVKDSKPIPNNPYGMYNSDDEVYFPEENMSFFDIW